MPDQMPAVGRLRAAAAMLQIAWTADPRRSILVFGLGAIEALAQSLLALWLKLLIDGIQAGDGRTVMLAAAATTASVAGSTALGYAGARIRAVLVEHARHRVDRRLLDLVGRTPTLEIHETPEHLTQLEIVQGRGGWGFGEIIPSMVGLLTLVVRIAATGLLLVSVDPVLLILPLFGLPALLLSSKIGSAVTKGDELAAEPWRRLDDLYNLATTAGPAKEVRLFRLADELLTRFGRTHHQMRTLRLRVHLRASAISIASRLVFLAGYIAAIVFVVDRAVAGQATIGDAVLTAVLAGQILGLVTGSADILTWVWRTLTAAARLIYLEDIARHALQRVDPSAEAPQRLTDGIRLAGVSYAYPHGKGDTLHEINLRLPAGATVAVVGDNGAGKSTLVKLLAGLYQPTTGQISIDDIHLASLDPHQWRQRVSAGFQDHARWEFLIRETVGIGDLANLHDESAVRDALNRAGATDTLTGLPAQLDTQLGATWPDGIDLSGGQWQKLALGRAMMRTSPLLLLLDEPTAALDADTEHQLFEQWTTAARRLRQHTGAVTILVSHRFSTVRMADLIIVLDHGKVVETGTHEQLTATNGLYAELFELQARSYR